MRGKPMAMREISERRSVGRDTTGSAPSGAGSISPLLGDAVVSATMVGHTPNSGRTPACLSSCA
jgi:hypothetical protein